MDRKQKSVLRLGIAATMFYLAFQIFADLMSIKMSNVFGMTVGAVFFVYPLTFTFRDLIHRYLGKSFARFVIGMGLVINIVMLGVAYIYVAMPYAPDAEFSKDAIELIFGNIWRIVLASLIAEFISEMVDTEVYDWWARKKGEKQLWGRVLLSNAVAGTIDVLLFNAIAWIGLFSPDLLVAVVRTELIIRLAMAVISIPFIYITPGLLDRLAPNVEALSR